MSELPRTRLARLEYFEARSTLWTANAAAIGLTPAQVTAIKNAAVANRTDFNAAEVARNASKAATTQYYNSGNTMFDLGRDLIKTIKAFAETTNNPNVYALANINPPAPPAPVPAPDAPTDLAGTLDNFGVATLTWKATRSGPSSGIFFVVERQRAGEAAFVTLGATSEKSFIDPDPRAASGNVSYRVKAVRGADESAWAQPIFFAIGGGGGGAVSGYVINTVHAARAA
jgi:hypothetical protein